MIYPRTGKRGAPQAFARKLFEIVESEPDDVIAWGPTGVGFVINDMDQFTNRVLMKYFRHCKFSSFQRQLNLYGFKKIHKGPTAGSYSNPFFQKDKPELMNKIVRARQKSKRDRERELKKGPSSPSTTSKSRPSQRKAGNVATSASSRTSRITKPSDVPLFSEIYQQTQRTGQKQLRCRYGSDQSLKSTSSQGSIQQEQETPTSPNSSFSSFFLLDWLLNPTMSLEGDERLPTDAIDKEIQAISTEKHDRDGCGKLTTDATQHTIMLEKQSFRKPSSSSSSSFSLFSNPSTLVHRGHSQQEQQAHQGTDKEEAVWSVFDPFRDLMSDPLARVVQSGRKGKGEKGTLPDTPPQPLKQTQQDQGQHKDPSTALSLPHQEVRKYYFQKKEQQQETSSTAPLSTNEARSMASESDSESDCESDSDGTVSSTQTLRSVSSSQESELYFDDLALTFQLLDITPPCSPETSFSSKHPLDRFSNFPPLQEQQHRQEEEDQQQQSVRGRGGEEEGRRRTRRREGGEGSEYLRPHSPLPPSSELDMDLEEMFALLA